MNLHVFCTKIWRSRPPDTVYNLGTVLRFYAFVLILAVTAGSASLSTADDRPLPELEGGLYGMEIELPFLARQPTLQMAHILRYLDFDILVQNRGWRGIDRDKVEEFLDTFDVESSLTEANLTPAYRQALGLAHVPAATPSILVASELPKQQNSQNRHYEQRNGLWLTADEIARQNLQAVRDQEQIRKEEIRRKWRALSYDKRMELFNANDVSPEIKLSLLKNGMLPDRHQAILFPIRADLLAEIQEFLGRIAFEKDGDALEAKHFSPVSSAEVLYNDILKYARLIGVENRVKVFDFDFMKFGSLHYHVSFSKGKSREFFNLFGHWREVLKIHNGEVAAVTAELSDRVATLTRRYPPNRIEIRWHRRDLREDMREILEVLQLPDQEALATIKNKLNSLYTEDFISVVKKNDPKAVTSWAQYIFEYYSDNILGVRTEALLDSLIVDVLSENATSQARNEFLEIFLRQRPIGWQHRFLNEREQHKILITVIKVMSQIHLKNSEQINESMLAELNRVIQYRLSASLPDREFLFAIFDALRPLRDQSHEWVDAIYYPKIHRELDFSLQPYQVIEYADLTIEQVKKNLIYLLNDEKLQHVGLFLTILSHLNDTYGVSVIGQLFGIDPRIDKILLDMGLTPEFVRASVGLLAANNVSGQNFQPFFENSKNVAFDAQLTAVQVVVDSLRTSLWVEEAQNRGIELIRHMKVPAYIASLLRKHLPYDAARSSNMDGPSFVQQNVKRILRHLNKIKDSGKNEKLVDELLYQIVTGVVLSEITKSRVLVAECGLSLDTVKRLAARMVRDDFHDADVRGFIRSVESLVTPEGSMTPAFQQFYGYDSALDKFLRTNYFVPPLLRARTSAKKTVDCVRALIGRGSS